jgi:DNA-binding transcriptional ArsR family regulator
MNATLKPLSSPEHIPHPPLQHLTKAIGAPLRWAILTELASGEPRMVKEIALKLRKSPTLVSKHMAVLRRAGAVEIGRAGVYQIPKHFVVAPDKRHIDFGHCLLRMPDAEPTVT